MFSVGLFVSGPSKRLVVEDKSVVHFKALAVDNQCVDQGAVYLSTSNKKTGELTTCAFNVAPSVTRTLTRGDLSKQGVWADGKFVWSIGSGSGPVPAGVPGLVLLGTIT